MAKIETTKQRSWLNKSDMAASLGISPQAFEKWGVEAVAKIGRETFYRVQDVLANRIAHSLRKQQPADVGEDGIDPLVEYKLMQERLRLTAAQADAQEKKNLVQDKLLVPAPFMTFALEKISSRIASKLETVGKTVSRHHPDIDPVILEAVEREIAIARNIAAKSGDKIPGFLDEYLSTLDS